MKYVIFETTGRLGEAPDFDGERRSLIEFGDLDPKIVMVNSDYAKAGSISEPKLWLAFRVRNSDVQAVVDAATFTFSEETIPADEVNLDEHGVVVVNTKGECTSVLDDESSAMFMGLLT